MSRLTVTVADHAGDLFTLAVDVEYLTNHGVYMAQSLTSSATAEAATQAEAVLLCAATALDWGKA